MTDPQAEDSSGTQPVSSSESPAETEGDSFMDTYGNPRLGTTEQRADHQWWGDKMIRRHEIKEGDADI